MGLFDASALANAPVRSVLNPGKYSARILSAKEILSSKKNTPGLEIELVVTNGPTQESGSEPINHHSFATLYSSNDPTKRGPFFSRVHGLADAAGIDLASFEGMPAEEFTPVFLETLINRDVVMVIANELYEGNPKEVVKGFEKP